MIYAILMAGGMGTRLEVPCEKPLFKLCNKPLIKYVLDNLKESKLIDKIVIAVSHHTPETTQYLNSLDGDFQILDTSGDSYLTDLSYILDYFEKKSDKDILLFINADLPFISTETIDYVLDYYFKSDKDALSTLVPVEIFRDLGLNYSYEFNGNVPSGLNVLRALANRFLVSSGLRGNVNLSIIHPSTVGAKPRMMISSSSAK